MGIFYYGYSSLSLPESRRDLSRLHSENLARFLEGKPKKYEDFHTLFPQQFLIYVCIEIHKNITI